MSISMKKLAEAAAPLPSSDSPMTPWRNVAIRPMEYDLETRVTTGIDITTGETLSIRLDDKNESDLRDNVSVWAAPRYRDRKGIREIANPKAVVSGPEGGVIIFEGVRSVEGGGPLEARWGNTASHSEGVAEVFSALVRPATAYGSRTAMDAKFAIEVIRPLAAQTVASIDQLKDALCDIINRPFVNACVRVLDSDDVVSTGLLWKPKDKSAEEAVDRFLSSDRLGRLLSDEVCQGAVVEVLPIERIYPGKDYQKVLGDAGKTDSKIFARDWSLGEGQGFGFAQTYVALRQYEAQDGSLGGWQLTKIRPESTRPVLYRGLEDLPTPNIQPKTAPVVAKSLEAPAIEEASSAEAPAAQGNADSALDSKSPDVVSEKLAAASRAFSKA